MRELTTIGNLHAFRRSADRSVRLRGIGYISATNSLYVPPSSSELLAEPPSDATANAAATLLEHFVSYGVPSEHVTDPVVLAFQKAVNADPASWAQRKPQLGVDGGFGNNSHDVAAALAAALGSDTAVPAVNTSNATIPYTSSSSSGGSVLTLPTIVVTGGKTTPATPTKPAALTTTTKSNAWKWVLGAGLAGVLAYAAHKMMKKRRARRRSASLPSRAIVLT